MKGQRWEKECERRGSALEGGINGGTYGAPVAVLIECMGWGKRKKYYH